MRTSLVSVPDSTPVVIAAKKIAESDFCFAKIKNISKTESAGDYVYDFPDLSLEFPTYRLVLKQPVEIKLKPSEHTEYKWVTPEECLAMPDTIRGLDKDLLEWAGYVIGRLS